MVLHQDVKLCGPTYTASAVDEKWDGLSTRGLLVFLTQEKLTLITPVDKLVKSLL